jgi:hypothetical protein
LTGKCFELLFKKYVCWAAVMPVKKRKLLSKHVLQTWLHRSSIQHTATCVTHLGYKEQELLLELVQRMQHLQSTRMTTNST